MYQLLRKRLGGKKGFTLIELIVVIAIIAILAVILIPRFSGFTRNARERSVLSEARNILMALEAIDADGRWPDSGVPSNAEVIAFLGKEFEGTLTISGKGTNGGASFTYYREISGQLYIVTCDDGVLEERVTVTAAPTPSPSGSGG